MDYIEIAKKLYPADEGDLPWVSDYTPILEHFGKIAVRLDDDDYQGDTRVLYADTGKGFGYLNFGWGSCSGCDYLQGCDTYEELAELIKELEVAIKWLPREDMLRFFKEHDWAGDYSWSEEFVAKAVGYLETDKFSVDKSAPSA